MAATQLALPGMCAPPPPRRDCAAAEADYRAAVARHRPLCRDPACLTDGDHWTATKAAQREVARAYQTWQRLLQHED